jgi:hypothetical protein
MQSTVELCADLLLNNRHDILHVELQLIRRQASLSLRCAPRPKQSGTHRKEAGHGCDKCKLTHYPEKAESGGPRGYDAGKKVKGRKRQVIVDRDGRALILVPQPADIQDRDGAAPMLRLSRFSFPFITKVFADMGFAGDGPANAASITVEIVRKPPDQVGFAVHPRR